MKRHAKQVAQRLAHRLPSRRIACPAGT
jgi:hypothetical protein